MDNSFEIIDGDVTRKFKVRRLDAMLQGKIARRILPIFGGLKEATGGPEGMDLEKILKAIAGITDDDQDFITHKLLSAVEMQQQNGNWAKVSNGQTLMFADLELDVVLQIVAKALQFNFEKVFRSPLLNSGPQG